MTTLYALRNRKTGSWVAGGHNPFVLHLKSVVNPNAAARMSFVRENVREYPSYDPYEAQNPEILRQREEVRLHNCALYKVKRDDPCLDPYRVYEIVKITMPKIINGEIVVPYSEEILGG